MGEHAQWRGWRPGRVEPGGQLGKPGAQAPAQLRQIEDTGCEKPPRRHVHLLNTSSKLGKPSNRDVRAGRARRRLLLWLASASPLEEQSGVRDVSSQSGGKIKGAARGIVVE